MEIELRKGYVLVERMFRGAKIGLSAKSADELGGAYRMVDSNGLEGFDKGDYVIMNNHMISYVTLVDDGIDGNLYGIYPESAVLGKYSGEELKRVSGMYKRHYSEVVGDMNNKSGIIMGNKIATA